MAGKPSAWVPDDLARAADIVRQISPAAAQEMTGALSNPPTPDQVPAAVPAPIIVSTSQGYKIGDPPTGRLMRPLQSEGWDKEVWAYYDAVGELHYVANQYGRAVSRARLYVAQYNEDGDLVECTTGEAGRLNRELLGGEARRGDLLYLSAVQQFMSGQSLITVTDDEGWEAFSDQDFTVDRSLTSRANLGKAPRSLYKVDVGTGQQAPLKNGTLTIHMWDRHPGKASTVDSSVRAALPYLRELARLDQYVQALLLSRIALSGILMLPPGTEVVIPEELQSPDVAPGASALMHVLATIGTTNISNPGTAQAVLPILVQLAKADQKLEHLSLDTPLTPQINEFRELNLKRTAMSMDMAPESMSGFSDVKYSNAEWIQSESIQTHIMRRVGAFVSALTTSYVLPAMKGDPSYLVAADLTELEADRDQTDAGQALYDRLVIDGEGLRRMSGAKGMEAPSDEDRLRILAERAVVTNPSLFVALAPLLGLREQINLLSPEELTRITDAMNPAATPTQDDQTEQSGQPEPDGQTDQPALPAPRPPQQLPPASAAASTAAAIPSAPSMAAAALVAACDVVVNNALAGAGSRWRKGSRARVAQCRNTEPAAVYLAHPLCADRTPDRTAAEHAAELIADRWQQVPRIAALHHADPTCLQHTLTAYVVDLIVTQAPHHPNRLADRVCACSSPWDTP